MQNNNDGASTSTRNRDGLSLDVGSLRRHQVRILRLPRLEGARLLPSFLSLSLSFSKSFSSATRLLVLEVQNPVLIWFPVAIALICLPFACCPRLVWPLRTRIYWALFLYGMPLVSCGRSRILVGFDVKILGSTSISLFLFLIFFFKF